MYVHARMCECTYKCGHMHIMMHYVYFQVGSDSTLLFNFCECLCFREMCITCTCVACTVHGQLSMNLGI